VDLKRVRSQSFVPIARARYVRSGDTLRAGPNSTVALNWADGTRVLIGPNTQAFEVLKCQLNRKSKDQTSLFKLTMGRVWVRVLQVLTKKSSFEIQTPTATAGVRGTIFSVAVDASGQTAVEVLKGAVSVQTAGGTTEVGAGKVGRTAGQDAVVTDMDAAAQAQWEQETEILGPALDLDTPPEGLKLPPAGQQVIISGKAERGTTVTVNDRSVETDARGRFDAPLGAPSGSEMEVVVRATDAKGMTTERTLRATR
jgi:hypothetical protein